MFDKDEYLFYGIYNGEFQNVRGICLNLDIGDKIITKSGEWTIENKFEFQTPKKLFSKQKKCVYYTVSNNFCIEKRYYSMSEFAAAYELGGMEAVNSLGKNKCKAQEKSQ